MTRKRAAVRKRCTRRTGHTTRPPPESAATSCRPSLAARSCTAGSAAHCEACPTPITAGSWKRCFPAGPPSSIGYANRPGKHDRLTATGALAIVTSLADLVPVLRARPLPN